MPFANVTEAHDSLRSDGDIYDAPMAAVKIFKGTHVIITAGYAAPVTDVTGSYYAGVAYETVDNTAGAAGAKRIRLFKRGDFEFVNSAVDAIVVADLMKPAYCDLNTTSGTPARVVISASQATATNKVKVGIVTEFISTTAVRICIDSAIGVITATK